MKYPFGKTYINNTPVSYDNRGMCLENDLNITNQFYIDNNIAFIYKKPTPIQITKVDYKNMKITEAYFKQPSTTDYNGLYKGYYIDFEAKETNNKTSFPLQNIHKHQIEHLKHVIDNKGIGFLIIRFTKLGKTFLLPAEVLLEFINNNQRNSIPIDYVEENGFIIDEKYNPRIDYIKIVNQLIGGIKNEK